MWWPLSPPQMFKIFDRFSQPAVTGICVDFKQAHSSLATAVVIETLTQTNHCSLVYKWRRPYRGLMATSFCWSWSHSSSFIQSVVMHKNGGMEECIITGGTTGHVLTCSKDECVRFVFILIYIFELWKGKRILQHIEAQWLTQNYLFSTLLRYQFINEMS